MLHRNTQSVSKKRALKHLPSTQKTSFGNCYTFIVSRIELNKYIKGRNRFSRTKIPLVPENSNDNSSESLIQVRKIKRNVVEPTVTPNPELEPRSILPLETKIPVVPNPTMEPDQTKNTQPPAHGAKYSHKPIPTSDKQELGACGSESEPIAARVLKIRRNAAEGVPTVTITNCEQKITCVLTPESPAIENKQENILTELVRTKPVEVNKVIPRVTLKVILDPTNVDRKKDEMSIVPTQIQPETQSLRANEQSKKPHEHIGVPTINTTKKVKGYKRNTEEARKYGRVMKPPGNFDSKRVDNRSASEEFANHKQIKKNVTISRGDAILKKPKVDPTPKFHPNKRRQQKANHGKEIRNEDKSCNLNERKNGLKFGESESEEKTPRSERIFSHVNIQESVVLSEKKTQCQLLPPSPKSKKECTDTEEDDNNSTDEDDNTEDDNGKEEMDEEETRSTGNGMMSLLSGLFPVEEKPYSVDMDDALVDLKNLFQEYEIFRGSIESKTMKDFTLLNKKHKTLIKRLVNASNSKTLFMNTELRTLKFKLGDLDFAIEKKIVFRNKPDLNSESDIDT